MDSGKRGLWLRGSEVTTKRNEAKGDVSFNQCGNRLRGSQGSLMVFSALPLPGKEAQAVGISKRKG